MLSHHRFFSLLVATVSFALALLPSAKAQQSWVGRNIATSAPDSHANIPASNFRNCGGVLFFKATIGLTSFPAISRGTTDSTWSLDHYNPGAIMPSDPDEFTLVGDTVFFVGFDPTYGRELWKVDINTFQLSLVKDILPGPNSSKPHSLAACNGKLVFACDADGGTKYGDELYVSDGTRDGTKLLKDIDVGPGDGNISGCTTIGGFTYFSAKKTGSSVGSVPWRTDGTPEGTIMLVNASFYTYADPGAFTNFNGSVYFFMKGSGGDYSLWKVNPAATGTSMVKEKVADRWDKIATTSNLMFFRGNSSIGGVELWKSDGNSAGTMQVADIRLGSSSGMNSYYGSRSELVAYNDKCVFVADDGIQGQQVWISDGTVANTKMIHPTFNHAGSSPPNPNSLIVFNNTVFFRMFLSDYGSEYFTTDGTNISAAPALDIYTGNKSGLSGYYNEQMAIGNSLFFVGTEPQYGLGLWRIGPPLTITTQPQSKLVAKGEAVTFNVAAASASPISYRWLKDNGNITGATADSYTVPTAALTDAGGYQAVLESGDGAATSDVAKLGVVDTFVPSSSGTAGSTVSLTVAANVPVGTTFQWKRENTLLTNATTSSGGLISGATAASLMITKFSANEMGSYTCTITFNSQTIVTQAASLTIAVLPVVLTQPKSRIVNEGASVTFTAAATVSASVTYQWTWNGANISGATAASFTLPSAGLPLAGEYRCKLTNGGGTTTTNAAKLVVVKTSNQPVNVLASGKLGLSVVVAAPTTATPVYLWRKDTVAIPNGALPDGAVVSGATTNSLIITNMGLTETGTYTCTVDMSDATALQSTVATVVVKSKPVVSVTPVPPVIVSGAYLWQLASIGGTTRYIVTGLPAGLTYNPVTGLISGTPTVTGNFTIKVIATNEVGSSPPQSFQIFVPALADNLAGSYSATIARSRAVNGNLGGLLKLSVLPNGTLTGTLANGGPALPLKGRVVASLGGNATYALTLVRAGLLDLNLAVTLDPVAQTLSGAIGDGTDSAAISGKRHSWSRINPAYGYQGTFNVTIDTSSTYAGIEYPQGRGWMQLVTDPYGVVTGSGRTMDGIPFTVSSTLWQNSKFALFNLLYNGRGCLLGQPAIVLNSTSVIDDRISGTLEHYKMPATTVPDRHYGAGFAILSEALDGSRWIAPLLGQMPMNWPIKQANARLLLSQGGITSAAQAAAFPQYFTLTANGTCVFDKALNVVAAKCNVNPKTGMVTGTFNLVDPVYPGSTATYVRPGSYTALMIPHLNNSFGSFILPQLPATGQTLLTSPQLTGRATVQPQ